MLLRWTLFAVWEKLHIPVTTAILDVQLWPRSSCSSLLSVGSLVVTVVACVPDKLINSAN